MVRLNASGNEPSRGRAKPLILLGLLLALSAGVLAVLVFMGRRPATEHVNALTSKHRIGDAEVSIASVKLGRPTGKMLGFGHEWVAEEDYLLVTLQIHNLGAGPLEYTKWRPQSAGLDPRREPIGARQLSLTDERGRRYNVILTLPFDLLAGEKFGLSGTLGPGEQTTDQLLFEKPEADVRQLILELAADNVGGLGKKIGFLIPTAMILPLPPPPE